MKRYRLLALLLAAAFVFSGCSIIKVNPERDGEQVVAEVNGEKITKKQVYDAAEITWETKVESWEIEEYKQKKEDALTNLIADMVIKQKARELGYYTFTADENKQIDDAVTSYKESNYDTLLKDYQEKAKADPSINAEAAANADIEKYREQQKDQTAAEKARKAVTDPIVPTEDEIKAAYDAILSQEKTQFDADPSMLNQYEMYAIFGYPPVIYYPTDGFVRVKQILVKIPDDANKEISDLREAGKKEDADKKRNEELQKILAKATDTLNKAIAAGGDLTKLNTLMKDNSEDTGLKPEDPGYLVYKESTAWMKEFTDAAMKLTDIGKPSELVATDYGYHILWLTEKIAKGDVPLDKVKDKMTELAKSEKQSQAWNDAVTAWLKEYNDKKQIRKYLDRLHN